MRLSVEGCILLYVPVHYLPMNLLAMLYTGALLN